MLRYVVEGYRRGSVEVQIFGEEKTKAKAIERAELWLVHDYSTVATWVWDHQLRKKIHAGAKGGFGWLLGESGTLVCKPMYGQPKRETVQ